jgi:hypothetical protein
VDRLKRPDNLNIPILNADRNKIEILSSIEKSTSKIEESNLKPKFSVEDPTEKPRVDLRQKKDKKKKEKNTSSSEEKKKEER